MLCRLETVLSKRFCTAPRSARWVSILEIALSITAMALCAPSAVVMLLSATLVSFEEAVVVPVSANSPSTPSPASEYDLEEFNSTAPVAMKSSSIAVPDAAYLPEPSCTFTVTPPYSVVTPVVLTAPKTMFSPVSEVMESSSVSSLKLTLIPRAEALELSCSARLALSVTPIISMALESPTVILKLAGVPEAAAGTSSWATVRAEALKPVTAPSSCLAMSLAEAPASTVIDLVSPLPVTVMAPPVTPEADGVIAWL